jgi:hypothetical protein
VKIVLFLIAILTTSVFARAGYPESECPKLEGNWHCISYPADERWKQAFPDYDVKLSYIRSGNVITAYSWNGDVTPLNGEWIKEAKPDYDQRFAWTRHYCDDQALVDCMIVKDDKTGERIGGMLCSVRELSGPNEYRYKEPNADYVCARK